MARRFLLLLLLPAGCAALEDRQALALRAAMESGQASLAAVGPAAMGAGLSASMLPSGASSSGSPSGPAAPLIPRPAGLADLGMVRIGPEPVSAAQLLGAGPDALRRWLGEPALRRPEAGAEVWLYTADGCALDLVLYPDGGRLRVAHAEARANGAEPRTEAACLRGIAAAPGLRASPTGDAAGSGA